MQDQYLVKDLKSALTEQLHPTITVWNRLEGRPRTDNFDRALKAEVRDALWMLTRQWQLGEFQGDDAGWPITAKLHMATTEATLYRPPTGEAEAFPQTIPLETQVERLPLRFNSGSQAMRLDLRAQLGRQWRKMLETAGLGAYVSQYRANYAFVLPAQDQQSDLIYAHRETWQQVAALAGRVIDGGALYVHLTGAAAQPASDGITLDDPAHAGALDLLGQQFTVWVGSLYSQPAVDQASAWQPPQLEYAFDVSAPQAGAEKVLSVNEYYHGHLDWYSFDHDASATGLGPVADAPASTECAFTGSFIPAPVLFEGMPDTRWWALEDRKTSFGDVKPSTTDLAQLMLVEFGLVYANDWFLLPFRLPLGTLANVQGMVVTNSFGERFWIEAAGKGSDQDWHRWNMFSLSVKGSQDLPADTSVFLPPVVAKIQEGDPHEEIVFVRDEMANMVWGIETVVPMANGYGRSGKDAAQEIVQYHQRLVDADQPPSVDYQAQVFYRAMTTVPEHWIPFIPVHVDGSNREVQLQRSRMLRIIEGDPAAPAKIPPRTSLLRQGLDSADKQPYFIHEEEVPRAGVRVTQSFQRTRWVNGESYVWLGVRKQTDRGERSSGLAFDTLGDANKQA